MSNISVTFAAGTAQSTLVNVGAIRLDGSSILGFRFPAAWPAGTTVFLLEADGTDALPRLLCDSAGTVFELTSMEAAAPLSNGKTAKDPAFPAIFYGIKNLYLYASPAPVAQQVVEVITDAVY